MTPLCPTCHGDCCVNKRGSVVDHGSVLALHSCPDCLDGFVTHTTHECDCLDGTAPAPDLAAERLAALLDAERENTALRAEVERLRGERGDTVAWLRSLQPHNTEVVAVYLQMLADVIERGGHRGGSK